MHAEQLHMKVEDLSKVNVFSIENLVDYAQFAYAYAESRKQLAIMIKKSFKMKWEQGKISEPVYLMERDFFMIHKVRCEREKHVNKLLRSTNLTLTDIYATLSDFKNLKDAYNHALLNQYVPPSNEPAHSGSEAHEYYERIFKNNVRMIYANKGAHEYWEPVLAKEQGDGVVSSVRIVPHHLKYDLIGDLFGSPGHGLEICWDPLNGLPLQEMIEPGFKEGRIRVIPVVKDDYKGDILQLFLLEDDRLSEYLAAVHKLTNSTLHRQRLVFKDALARPRKRCLYYHMVISIFRMIRRERPTWIQQCLELNPEIRDWANSERWFSRRVLRTLAQGITGDADDAWFLEETNSSIEYSEVSDRAAEEVAEHYNMVDYEESEEAKRNSGWYGRPHKRYLLTTKGD